MSKILLSYVYPGDHIAWLAALWLMQSTGAIALAWLLAHCVARNRPAMRHGIWFWTLVSIVLTPILATGAERAGFSLLDLASHRPGLHSPPPAQPVESVRPTSDVELKLVERLLGERGTSNPAQMAREGTAASVAAFPGKGDDDARTWAEGVRAALACLFVVWAIGTAVLCVRLAIGWRIMERLKADGRPIDDADIRHTLAEVLTRLGPGKLPRILASDALDRPVATGLLGPAVILPARMLETMARRRLCDILVHECAHLRRGDHFVGLLQRLAEVAFWPQPLLSLLNRELARAREEVCDNYALLGGDRVAYSWTLLEVTESATAPTQLPTAFGLLSSPWKLEDRIAGLLDERRDLMTNLNRRISVLIMAVFLLTSTGFAGLSFGLDPQVSEISGTADSESTAVPGRIADAKPTESETPASASAPPETSNAADRLVEQLRQGPVARADQEEELALYLLSIDQGKAALITNEPARDLRNCGSPRWSNDGRRILFDATPGREWIRTRMKSIDLTQERLVISDLGVGNCPSPSPDGKRIAFHLNPGALPNADMGIWIMDADGSNRRRLGEFGVPQWSPDGRQLLITSFSSPTSQVLLDVESGRKTPVVVPGYRLWSFPSWAGDGTIVAVASGNDGAAIVLIDITHPEEGKIKEILWKKGDRLEANPSFPVYSAASGRCVFVANEKKGMALYSVQRGNFGPPKRLETHSIDHKIASLALSPDGRYLLFCCDRPTLGRTTGQTLERSAPLPENTVRPNEEPTPFSIRLVDPQPRLSSGFPTHGGRSSIEPKER